MLEWNACLQLVAGAEFATDALHSGCDNSFSAKYKCGDEAFLQFTGLVLACVHRCMAADDRVCLKSHHHALRRVLMA